MRNTLWLMVVFVPLQVLFALGVAMMLARARRGVGFFRTVFYLPALAPTVAATLAFVYLLNPATGPVNTILGRLGIEGPLWFHSPQWSKPALGLLGLWGIGNLMIIFLAAVIDVPTHLYESSELDGAGPWQRLRYVTLALDQPGDPVRGRDRGHRQPAVLHAGVRRGRRRPGPGRLRERDEPRLPGGLDALLPGADLPAGVPLLQHGLRLGDGDAPARRGARRDAADPAQLAALGLLPGSGARR